MAESIGGILISVGMNTSEYEKGVKKVKDSEAKIYKIEKDYRIKSAEQEQRIENALKNAQEADDKLFLAQQKLKKNATKANEKAVRDLTKEYEKLLKVHTSETDKLKVLNAKREKSLKIAKEELATQQKQLANTGKFQKLKSSLMSVKGVLTGGVVMGAVAGFDKLMGKLDGLAKRAKDVGMTASQLQELEHQAKLAGMETGNLDSAVKTFNKNISLAGMGTGKAKDAIAKMGISLKDANGATKTQSQLLREVALKFAENAGSAENAGLATKIFGDNGAEMLRIFEQGEGVINKVFNAKGIDEAAAAAERYKDNLENIQNVAFKMSARVVEGWSQIADAVQGIDREAEKQEKSWNERVKNHQRDITQAESAYNKAIKDGNTQLAELNKETLEVEKKRQSIAFEIENIESKIANAKDNLNKSDTTFDFRKEQGNKLREYYKELKELKARSAEEARKIEEVERKKAFAEQMRQMQEINREIAESAMAQKSTAMQIAVQKSKIAKEEEKLKNLTLGTVEYTKQYKTLKQETLKLQNLEKKNAEEIKKSAEEIANKTKKALEDRKKSLETELKSKKEQLARMQTTREEFELNLEIQKLENGNDAQKAQAQAIKNGLKRNELMQKYGYSLEEANKKMREMLKLEADKNNKGKDGKGKFEYSEEDVERAKRLLKRGEGGTVGKKSLEQAQKIVNGEDIGDTEYSGFIGAKKRAKEVKQNNDVGIASNAEINAVKPKNEQGKSESDLPKTMQDLSKEIKNLSKEINDLKNVTRDGANNKKD